MSIEKSIKELCDVIKLHYADLAEAREAQRASAAPKKANKANKATKKIVSPPNKCSAIN